MKRFLAWYTTRPVLAPYSPAIKVNYGCHRERGNHEEKFVDWQINRPYILFLILVNWEFYLLFWRIANRRS